MINLRKTFAVVLTLLLSIPLFAMPLQHKLEQLKGNIRVDPYELGAWDCETTWTRGRFLRQKCYIEEIDGEIHATVAGMPKKLAHLINFDNFNIGFTTEAFTDEEVGKGGRKLRYVHTDGGVVLMPTEFSIK